MSHPTPREDRCWRGLDRAALYGADHAAVPSAPSHAVSARDLESFGGLVRAELYKQWTMHPSRLDMALIHSMARLPLKLCTQHLAFSHVKLRKKKTLHDHLQVAKIASATVDGDANIADILCPRQN